MNMKKRYNVDDEMEEEMQTEIITDMYECWY